MSQAEAVLVGMVEEGWFEKSRAGYYSLSPRALMELRGWLVETYNEPPGEEGEESEEDDGAGRERIKFCQACREIVTVVSDPLIMVYDRDVFVWEDQTRTGVCWGRFS